MTLWNYATALQCIIIAVRYIIEDREGVFNIIWKLFHSPYIVTLYELFNLYLLYHIILVLVVLSFSVTLRIIHKKIENHYLTIFYCVVVQIPNFYVFIIYVRFPHAL